MRGQSEFLSDICSCTMLLYIHKIFDFVNQLDEVTATELQKISLVKNYKKGDLLLRAGEVCHSNFVIEKGIARKYYVHNDKEITTEIYFEKEVAVSLDSYIMQKPGKDYVEALTDVSVIVVNYAKFQEAKKKFPELVSLDLMFMEYYAVWFEKRLVEYQTMDATQRYLKIIEKSPHYIQNIPLTIIASYLGISLETLSRIRTKI